MSFTIKLLIANNCLFLFLFILKHAQSGCFEIFVSFIHMIFLAFICRVTKLIIRHFLFINKSYRMNVSNNVIQGPSIDSNNISSFDGSHLNQIASFQKYQIFGKLYLIKRYVSKAILNLQVIVKHNNLPRIGA
mgnify:FL=1